MKRCKVLGLMLSVVLVVGLWAVPSALAEEKPRRGGILNVALAGDPPSLDMHQEQTFMVAQPMGPVYNNLIVLRSPQLSRRSLATWPNPGRSRTIT